MTSKVTLMVSVSTPLTLILKIRKDPKNGGKSTKWKLLPSSCSTLTATKSNMASPWRDVFLTARYHLAVWSKIFLRYLEGGGGGVFITIIVTIFMLNMMVVYFCFYILFYSINHQWNINDIFSSFLFFSFLFLGFLLTFWLYKMNPYGRDYTISKISYMTYVRRWSVFVVTHWYDIISSLSFQYC